MTVGSYGSVAIPLGAGTVFLQAPCLGAGGSRSFSASMSSGAAQWSGLKSTDNTNIVPFVGIQVVQLGYDGVTPINTTGHRYRAVGTVILQEPGAVTTIVYDMGLDDTGPTPSCTFYGTAVKGS